MDEKGCWDISQRHRVHRDRVSGFGKEKKLILAYLASLWFRDFLPPAENTDIITFQNERAEGELGKRELKLHL